MSENGVKNLTPRQRKAIEALLAGAKLNEAAVAAGVHPRTLSRWKEQEAFAFHLRRLSTLAVKDAATRLTGGMDAMLDVLQEVALDDEAPRHVRIRAALGWIDRQTKLVEVADILERLESLEAVVRLEEGS
jgi:hypothetical protein